MHHARPHNGPWRSAADGAPHGEAARAGVHLLRSQRGGERRHSFVALSVEPSMKRSRPVFKVNPDPPFVDDDDDDVMMMMMMICHAVHDLSRRSSAS